MSKPWYTRVWEFFSLHDEIPQEVHQQPAVEAIEPTPFVGMAEEEHVPPVKRRKMRQVLKRKVKPRKR